MPSKSSRRAQPAQASPTERFLRIVALLGLVAVFALSGLLGVTRQNTAASGASSTPGIGSPTPLVFPTVPSTGTLLTLDKTYIHPSALFSVPHIVGWDLPPNGEEKLDPSNGIKISRAGATFINGAALSVAHIFVERDPDRKPKTVSDLSAYYDKTNLDAAWTNFTGGYKETKRHTDGDKFVIDFELYLNGNTFLGRQVSQFDGDWLKVTRLVTPDNNPQLMDTLQTTIWANFAVYAVQANTPISWPSINDSVFGYAVRYRPEWSLVNGTSGTAFIVSGTLNGATITMSTKVEPNKSIKADTDVRAWVTAQQATNAVLTVQPTTVNGVSGFNVSYNDPDADGNPRSAVSTLLNSPNGTLYTLTFVTSTRSLDLLGTDPTVPNEFAQLRATFMLLPVAQLIATLTPTATNTATITATSTNTPDTTPTLTSTNTSTQTVTSVATLAATIQSTVAAVTAAVTVVATSASTIVPATTEPTLASTIVSTTAPTVIATIAPTAVATS